MRTPDLIRRLHNRFCIEASSRCGRRIVELQQERPVVSFTFDHFPNSALQVGGEILKRHGCVGTYYVSLGLMDQEIPAGHAFSKGDLCQVVADGHELGCHTYAHCHAWETAPPVFEESIIANKRALQEILPGAEFKSLSYPIGLPRPETKRRMAGQFTCCRGGGPRPNLGWADANNLRATFLEKHRNNPEALLWLIEENVRARGWLIFATHDVDENPSAFGCTPALFESVVRAASNSGTRVMPVAAAWDALTVKG